MDIRYQVMYYNIIVLYFVPLCQPLLLYFDLKAIEIWRVLITLINMHPCSNSNQLISCAKHSTKPMITMLDAMFSDAIDLR